MSSVPLGNSKHALNYTLTNQSIKYFIESHGYDNIKPDLIGPFASDITYHLKQIIRNACQFMIHSRRDRLSVSDIQKAFENSKVPLSFGHNNCTKKCLDYRFNTDMGIWFADNNIVSLHQECQGEIDLDEYNCNLDLEISLEGEDVSNFTSLNAKEHNVYSELATALMNKNPPIAQYALSVLRENGRILNIIIWILKDMLKLTRDHVSESILIRVQEVIRNILLNKKLKLYSRSVRDLIFEVLLFQIEEPLNCGDQIWPIKDNAIHLLLMFLERQYQRKEELYQMISERMIHIVLKPTSNYKVYYGPIKTLMHFGVHNLEVYQRVSSRFFELLIKFSDTNSQFGADPSYSNQLAYIFVREAIRDYLMQILFPNLKKEILSTNECCDSSWHHPIISQSNSPIDQNISKSVYLDFIEYFGTSFSCMLPMMQILYVIQDRVISDTAFKYPPDRTGQLDKPPNLLADESQYPSASSSKVDNETPPLLLADKQPKQLCSLKNRKLSTTAITSVSHGKRRSVTMKNLGWSGKPLPSLKIQFKVKNLSENLIQTLPIQSNTPSEFYTLFHKTKKYVGHLNVYNNSRRYITFSNTTFQETHMFSTMYSISTL